MTLTISPLAEQDLEEIGDYIAQDNPARAATFISSLHQQCREISEAPQLYRERPEWGERIRTCAYGRYLIVFSWHGNDTRIERVLHGARDISRLLSDDR